MIQKLKGFTLIEVLVAGAIFSGLSLYIAMQMNVQAKFSQRAIDQMDLNANLSMLESMLSTSFERGRNVAFTQIGSTVSGFRVFENGVMIIATDLRHCADFNPANSNNATNMTQVRVACCNEDIDMTASLPPVAGLYAIGSSTRVVSACTDTPGLSIEYWRNGTTLRSMCIPNVNRFNISDAGSNNLRGSDMFLIEIQAGRVLRGVANFGNVHPSTRMAMFESVGNGVDDTGNFLPLIIPCSGM